MRVFAGILTTILTVTLAITIGNRVPPDTVAMAAGVVLGAAAAAPPRLALGLVAQRRSATPLPVAPPPLAAEPVVRPYAMADSYASARDYPPLVIINPSAYQASRTQAHAAAYLDNTPMLHAPRQFRIVGDEAA